MGAAKYYYYHWMFDTLPKMPAEKSGMFEAVDYFWFPHISFLTPKNTWVISAFSRIKLLMKMSNIILKPSTSCFVPRFVYRIISPNGPAIFYMIISEIILHARRETDWIHLARRCGTKSEGVKWIQVMDLLKKYGFEVYFYLEFQSSNKQAF